MTLFRRSRGRADEGVTPLSSTPAEQDPAKAAAPKRVRVLGRRGVAVSTSTFLLIVVIATALATTVGIVAVHALTSPDAPTPSPSAAPPVTGDSTTTTTTAPLPPALAKGPSQANAPTFPVSGGEQPGYGNFNGLTCPDATHCVAVGADNHGNGVASLSSDGGSSWSNLTLPKNSPVLNAVACADRSHCVAVGQGAIVVTADEGTTWSVEALPTADTTLLGANCPTASVCVASGIVDNPTGPYDASVVRSTDGGATWQAATVPAGTYGIADIVCPTATDCLAVGASILVSHDAGATWTMTTVPGGTGELRTVSCASSTQCVAIGPNPQGLHDSSAPAIAIETTDGGDTWSSLSLPAGTATLDQISCSSATQCLAGGLSPTVGQPAPFYQSNDGGGHWTQATSTPKALSAIAAIACPDANHCAVVGRQTDGKAATGVSSDLASWSTKPLPGDAVPPSTDALS
jgi:photosystem II stability/assembly factor-like uncharacterized protein